MPNSPRLLARTLTFFLLPLFLALPFKARALDQGSADALATSILASSGRSCAVVSVPRCGSGELVVSFWNKIANAHGMVDGFDGNSSLLTTAQQTANSLGLLGRNIYLRSGTLSTGAYSMPYADNLVDLVVATNLQDADFSNISYSEMERVLCNSGQAWIGRATSEGAGLSTSTLNAWISGSHALSTATVVSGSTGNWAVITKISRLPNTYEGGGSITNAGNRFFPDYVATWPTLPQWCAKPLGSICSGSTSHEALWGFLGKLCVGGGRMYGIDDDGTLCGLRAQSGILLWKRPGLSQYSAGGIQPFSQGVVYSNQIIAGETGVTTGTIPILSNWTGMVSYQVNSDILYAVGRGSDNINTLLAYDLMNKTTLYSIPNFADNNSISTYLTGGMLGELLDVVIAGGKLYTNSGTLIYCYNTADGSKNWGPITAPASPTFIEASPNGLFLQVGYSGTVNYYFFNGADGLLAWGPKAVASPHSICDIATISTLNGGKETICTQGNGHAIDLLTGVTKEGVGFYGAGQCLPGASMSPAGFYSRRAGISYSMALKSTLINSSDPYASDCTDSPFFASGLTIVKDKSYCSCYGLFRGTTAQAPLSTFNPEQTAIQSQRLQQGPAYGNVNVQVTPDGLDWPTHRANINRSGYVPAQVSTSKCVQLWKYTNPTPNDYDMNVSDEFYTYGDVTPPVSAGNYLTGTCFTYFAGSDGIVKCLNNNTGNLVWSYATGGWIFGTPTVANGCVYVGSGDGSVYCLEAQTGRLVWQFRAAPAERRFNYFGHMISTWPVVTGVLAHPNGNVYFASGIMDEYGVQVFALNAQTGAIVWQNTAAGICLDNRPGLARVGHWPGGYITAVGNQLMVKETTHAYANSNQRIDVYDLNTGAISPNDTGSPRNFQNGAGAFCTGRQIGVMGSYVVGWGEDLHTEMGNDQYSGGITLLKFDALGNPVKPLLILQGATRTGGNIEALVWDNTEAYLDAWKYEMVGTGTANLFPYLDYCVANPPPTLSDTTKLCTVNCGIGMPAKTTDPKWKPVTVGGINRADALTANCVIEANTTGDIGVMDRTTGVQYFHVNSGGDPYLQGMAVDRSGKIIVVNRVGDVVCFGTPDPAVVTQPSNMSGVASGQSATFSVEAAGLGLTYQWEFSGAVIAGATSATYNIASVSDSNAGVYNCVIANTTGTVTTASGRLSTAVTASLTSPTNGSTFSQPGDLQSPAITLSASASSLNGTITKVEYYSSGTNLMGSATTAPYSFTWTTGTPGTYALTCKAYDSLGKTGLSQPVNVTIAALVTHYALDETAGTTAYDSSGNSNNGTLWYGPSWVTQGLFNGSLHFNDSTTRRESLTTGPITALSGSTFTVGYWVNYDGNPVYGSCTLCCKPASGNSYSYLSNTNYPTITWATVGGTTVHPGGSATWHYYTPGVWYHYAIVATPQEIDWYINGSLFASYTPPSGDSFITSYQSFGFGGKNPAAGNSSGLVGMDEIKIYNRALSPADISAMGATNVPYRLPLPTVSLTSPTNGQIVTATNGLILSALTSGSHFPIAVNYYANGNLIGTGTTAPNYSVPWNSVARGTYAVTGTITDGRSVRPSVPTRPT